MTDSRETPPKDLLPRSIETPACFPADPQHTRTIFVHLADSDSIELKGFVLSIPQSLVKDEMSEGSALLWCIHTLAEANAETLKAGGHIESEDRFIFDFIHGTLLFSGLLKPLGKETR